MVGLDRAVDFAEPAAAVGDASAGGGKEDSGRRGGDANFRGAGGAGSEEDECPRMPRRAWSGAIGARLDAGDQVNMVGKSSPNR